MHCEISQGQMQSENLSPFLSLSVSEFNTAASPVRPELRFSHLSSAVHLFVSSSALPDRQTLLHPALPPR